MGIPLEIFSLYRFEGAEANCRHYLLLRIWRPGFSNADEGDYARAVDVADRRRGALVEEYEAGTLAAECAARHMVKLAGELQSSPTGDELLAERGGFDVELWVAGTRFGHPWVVLGTAESEEEFWRAVESDGDLSRLGAQRPAKRRRAYFLTD